MKSEDAVEVDQLLESSPCYQVGSTVAAKSYREDVLRSRDKLNGQLGNLRYKEGSEAGRQLKYLCLRKRLRRRVVMKRQTGQSEILTSDKVEQL